MEIISLKITDATVLAFFAKHDDYMLEFLDEDKKYYSRYNENEEIEKINVKGFGFSEDASINVICIPSDKTKISVGYGDELREAGFAVSLENKNAVLIATAEEISGVSESFDLRIWADFEKVSVETENFGYVIYGGEPEEPWV